MSKSQILTMIQDFRNCKIEVNEVISDPHTVVAENIKKPW